MIPRLLENAVSEALAGFPVVGLLGPRQVGKTTLALAISRSVDRATVYLDLERDSDLNKLADAELYLGGQRGKLVIIDEVQRRPQLFRLLRSLVDERIRSGEQSGHFLVLGSASRDLLQQSSESLAGRIAYFELAPFSWHELRQANDRASSDRLWLRGGFADSYLARTEDLSWAWRSNFITTYLERDIPQLGPRFPAEQMRRLWTMIGHAQATPLNASRLAASLGVSAPTVRRYLDLLTDVYMLRQLPPWSGNSSKRLVKAPKIFVRDSGLLHRLTNIPDREALLGHPLCGASWEGFVIENILREMPDTWMASYFRSASQTEVDLVLEGPRRSVIAIEVKRTLSPTVTKGFLSACKDVGASQRYFVVPGGERYLLGHDTEVLPFESLADMLAETW